MITDEKKRAIFDEIASILEPPRQLADEITVREYAELSGCTRRQAYDRLMKAATDGIITKRKVLADRNWPWVFRMIRDEEITD